MKNKTTQQAIIYARVSSKKQLATGHGNESQEQTCRAYAESKGYKVIQVFAEPGISGGTVDRPALFEMMELLKKRAKMQQRTVVIVDDLKRFSRDLEGYIFLKKKLHKYRATLESPHFTIDPTPAGKLVETIIAATAEWERAENRLQVIRRMKARLENGYWPFPDTLPGLKYKKEPAHGKVMRRDEPKATIIQEALEGFAAGRFEMQADVQAFLQHHKVYKKVTGEHVRMLLERAVYYAGYIEYKKWNVSRRPGHHDALISKETYDRIQDRIASSFRVYVKKDRSADFPMHGYLRCSECSFRLRAAWSTGRHKKYPYYRCNRKECANYGKSVSAEMAHEWFEGYLASITPSPELYALSRANLVKKWDERMGTLHRYHKAIQKELAEIEEQQQSLALRIAKTTSEVAAAAFERSIETLESKRLELMEKEANTEPGNFSLEEGLNRVNKYLENPLEVWKGGNKRDMRRAVKLYFSEDVPFDVISKSGTPTLSLSYAFLSGNLEQNDGLTKGCGHGRN